MVGKVNLFFLQHVVEMLSKCCRNVAEMLPKNEIQCGHPHITFAPARTILENVAEMLSKCCRNVVNLWNTVWTSKQFWTKHVVEMLVRDRLTRVYNPGFRFSTRVLPDRVFFWKTRVFSGFWTLFFVKILLLFWPKTAKNEKMWKSHQFSNKNYWFLDRYLEILETCPKKLSKM